MYAILLNGELDRYPLSLTDLRRAFTQVNFAVTPAAAELRPFGIVWVSAVEPPAHDPDSETLIEDTPQCVAGEWVQTWAVEAIPPEEAGARLQARRAGMTCSRAQGQLALLQAGLLDTVESWVSTQPRATQIEYAERGEWRRDWPLVVNAGTALGMTDSQLDDLFTLAPNL